MNVQSHPTLSRQHLEFRIVRRFANRRYAARSGALASAAIFLLLSLLPLFPLAAPAQDNPFEQAAQASFSGRFVGPEATLRLKPEAGKWTGSLTFKGSTYTLQADNKEGKLEGTFGEDASPFTAVCDDDTLTFTAGTIVAKCQRQKLPKFTGLWGSAKVELEFEDAGDKLTGKIRFIGKEYSFAAAEKGGDLEGLFKNADKSIPFTVANEPRGLIFQTGPFAEKIQRKFINSLGIKFVPVPGTEVLFGVWDVRVQDYRAYAEASSGVDESWKEPGFAQGDTHPVVKVSWNDAKAFCAWLSRKEGKTYRLPTDAEWSVGVGLGKEFGSTPNDKHMKSKGVYPWGTAWPPPAGAGNYAESLKADCYEYTSPVGSFVANQFGLYDMGGNVWQWCEDWSDGEQGHRVARGAAWKDDYPNFLVSSCRDSSGPYYQHYGVGFRVVLVTAEVDR